MTPRVPHTPRGHPRRSMAVRDYKCKARKRFAIFVLFFVLKESTLVKLLPATQQVGMDGQKNLLVFFVNCTDMFRMTI